MAPVIHPWKTVFLTVELFWLNDRWWAPAFGEAGDGVPLRHVNSEREERDQNILWILMLVDDGLRECVEPCALHFVVNEDDAELRIVPPEEEIPTSFDDNLFLMLRVSLERNRDGLVRTKVDGSAARSEKESSQTQKFIHGISPSFHCSEPEKVCQKIFTRRCTGPSFSLGVRRPHESGPTIAE